MTKTRTPEQIAKKPTATDLGITIGQQLPPRKHDGKPVADGKSRDSTRARTIGATALDIAESMELHQTVNALESLADLEEQIAEWKQTILWHARARDNHSWATIGTALGTTRQGAQQRYGKSLL